MKAYAESEFQIEENVYHLIHDVSHRAVSSRFYHLDRINKAVKASDDEYLKFLLTQHDYYFWRFVVTAIWVREFNAALVVDPLPCLRQWMELSESEIETLFKTAESVYQPKTPEHQKAPGDLPDDMPEDEKKDE